jgi:Transposase
MPVADICRKAGISQATYFNWKKKYDGPLPTEMRRKLNPPAIQSSASLQDRPRL